MVNYLGMSIYHLYLLSRTVSLPSTSRSIWNYSNSQLWQQRQQQQITGNHRYTEAFLSPVKARVYTPIATVQSQFFPFTSPPQQCAGIRDRFCVWLPHTFKQLHLYQMLALKTHFKFISVQIKMCCNTDCSLCNKMHMIGDCSTQLA